MREALILGGLGSAISPEGAFCLKTLRFNPYTNKRILGAKVHNGKGTCTEYSVTRSRTEVSSQFIVSSRSIATATSI